ncbi:MAG: alpha/beta hydrolase [Alphaproteobacteria bacterium]|nr:alpha/beta hydrolase [Alphaproteobacteria bacterium]
MSRMILACLMAIAVMFSSAAVRAGDARFTIPYGPDLRQRVDIFMPDPPKPGMRRAAVVYFHGGGWTIGSRVLNHHIGRAIMEMGYVAVLADYRLYPFVRFPAFVHDGARAVGWLRRNSEKYGVGRDRIYLMGHSAGAHIAMLLALDPRYFIRAGVPMHAVRGVIGLSGPYTATPTRTLFRPIFGGLANPQAARPITFVRNVGPRMLLLHGGADLSIPPKQAREMGRRYRDAGGEATVRVYPGASHMQLVTSFAQSERWRHPVFKDVKSFIGPPSDRRRFDGIQRGSRPTIRSLELDRQ